MARKDFANSLKKIKDLHDQFRFAHLLRDRVKFIFSAIVFSLVVLKNRSKLRSVTRRTPWAVLKRRSRPAGVAVDLPT